MKRTLFLLSLVAGIAMAEEEMEEAREDARTGVLKVLKATALAAVLGPVGVLIEIGLQIVILIALIMFISTLKAQTGDVFGSLFGKGEEDYGSTGYYPAPAYESYDSASGGGSSYASYKRSVNEPSLMDIPMVQRLTARIHEAIDNFNY